MEVSERLKELLKYLGETPAGFAKSLGYQRPEKVYNWVDGKFKPKDDAYALIKATFPYVNTEWLKRGIGSMIVGEMQLSPLEEENKILKQKVAELEGKVSALEGVLVRALGKHEASKSLPVDNLLGVTFSPMLGRKF